MLQLSKSNFIIIILSVFITSHAFSQNADYAQSTVSELASEKYHGRGYVKNGDAKAAKYIAKQFKINGINMFGDSYFQKYSFPINTLPSTLNVSIDGDELVPGEDYVVSLSAKTINEEFNIRNFVDCCSNPDSLFLSIPSIVPNDIYLINEKNTKKLYGQTIPNAKAVAILTDKTPYWHVSNGGQLANTTWLKIRKDKVPDSAKTIKIKVKNKFISNHKTQNVVGYIKGSKYPEKFFVFTAHYDHLGMMGNKTYYPGANDNASGTAFILDLARHYSLPENQPEYSVVFILLSGEEVGLYGSKYFVDNSLFPLKDIKLVVNLDMVGSGSDGITVVNGTLYDTLMHKLQSINSENKYLKDIKSRGESCNSDHCPFFQKGINSIFIYTRGKELTEYHTITDKPDNFPFTAYNGLFGLITEIVEDY